MKLKKFPVIITADDYHEFAFIVNNVAAVTVNSKKLRYDELGCYYGEYIAVLYEGKKPTKEELCKLLLKQHPSWFLNDTRVAAKFLKNGSMYED